MRLTAMSLGLFLMAGCWDGFLSDFDLDFNFNFDFDLSMSCWGGEVDWSCMSRSRKVATGAMWETSIGHAPEGAALVSGTPSVVSVEALGDQRYALRAERSGVAALEILALDGTPVDSVQIAVRDAVSLELSPLNCVGAQPGPLHITVGDSCILVAIAADADGDALFAGANAEWSPSHEAPIDLLYQRELELLPHGAVAVGTSGPFMRLDGIAEGPSLVGCTVAGVFAMRTIQVTDPDAAVDPPDAAVDDPDAAVNDPDAGVDGPDAAVDDPGAATID